MQFKNITTGELKLLNYNITNDIFKFNFFGKRKIQAK